ncbi:hypothetical protein JF110_001655 [Campylobacter jejuni]|nr:hypothetical protein [Campylobacter jejuni]
MSHKVKITNVLNAPVKAFYRMPQLEGEKKFNPILEVYIQPRALMNEIIFPTEEYFKEWRRQNEHLFTKGYLIIDDKINEKTLKAKVEEVADKDNAVAKEKSNKAVENLQEAADNINATIEFKEEPVGKSDKKSNKK